MTNKLYHILVFPFFILLLCDIFMLNQQYEMCGGIEIKDDDHRMIDSLIGKSLRNS